MPSLASNIACKTYDVIIIGAGPSGLATATGLARQMVSAVVLDSGLYRNARASHMHNVAGYDHVPPPTFRARARECITSRYNTVEFQSAEVVRIENIEAKSQAQTQGKFSTLFIAHDADGQRSWTGKQVVLATGVHDVMPKLPGFHECWGTGILHCMFCHGYEERNAPSVGILSFDGMSSAFKNTQHISAMAKRLVKDAPITIYTNGDFNEDMAANYHILETKGYQFDKRAIEGLKLVKLEGNAGYNVIIKFKDGTEKCEGFLIHQPWAVLNGPFVQQLGLQTTESGVIKTTPLTNETSKPGVYAVGDCALEFKIVSPGLAMGTMTAVSIVGTLLP